MCKGPGWPGGAGTHTTAPSSRSCPNRADGWSGAGDILQRGLRLREEELRLVIGWYQERLGLTLPD